MLKSSPSIRVSRRGVTLAVVLLAGGPLLAGCGERALRVSNIYAANNPLNVLSSVVTFAVTGADSARVIYRTSEDTTSATPYEPVTGSTGRVVILGLLPFTRYTLTVEVKAGHRHTSADAWYYTRGLPPSVQAASLAVTGRFSRGLTLVSPLALNPTTDSAIAVAFDAVGRLRWYRMFDVTGSTELKQQPNGHFTIALPLTSWSFSEPLVRASTETGSPAPRRHAVPGGYDGTPQQYVEFLPSGEIVRTYTAGDGEFTDSHELLMTGPPQAPALHLFGYTRRPFNFASLGGPADAMGVGHQLIRESPPGVVQFKWDAWDHYGPADWIEPTGVHPPDDFDHPNSIDFDLDGNYILSFRNMGAIVKVNARTGATMWQLGGRRNQFEIRNDPLGGFSGQHSVRVLPNGHLLIYDNGLRHKPPRTRAVEYALDEAHHVATMVWEYEPTPAFLTTAFGSVQRLRNGNTLVGFGYAGQIREVDAKAHPVAIASFVYGEQNTFYRATRIASLYQYEAP